MMPTFLTPEQAPRENENGRPYCPDCGEELDTRRQPEPVVRLYKCRGGCQAVFRHHVTLPGEPWERVPISASGPA